MVYYLKEAFSESFYKYKICRHLIMYINTDILVFSYILGLLNMMCSHNTSSLELTESAFTVIIA